jgi:hypothetical protein
MMKLHHVGLEDLTTFRDQLRQEESLLEEANIHAAIAGDDLVYSLLSRLRSVPALPSSMRTARACAFLAWERGILHFEEGKETLFLKLRPIARACVRTTEILAYTVTCTAGCIAEPAPSRGNLRGQTI